MADIYHLTLHPPVLCQTDAFKPFWRRRQARRPNMRMWSRESKVWCENGEGETWAGGGTYGVIQSIDVQHHRFGPFVAGAQKEMSFTLAGGRLPFRSLGFFIAGRLQNLVDLRSQQFGFPGRSVPLVWETDTHSRDRTLDVV